MSRLRSGPPARPGGGADRQHAARGADPGAGGGGRLDPVGGLAEAARRARTRRSRRPPRAGGGAGRARGGRAGRWRRSVRSRRRGTRARRSGSGPRRRRPRAACRATPSSRQASTASRADAVVGGRGRDLAGSRACRYQASTPSSAQKAPIRSAASSAATADGERRRVAPARPASRPARSTSPRQKPPLRPLGPRPQTGSDSRIDDARLGGQPVGVPGGPHAGVAAADDQQVGVAILVQRRARCDVSRLLDPVTETSVLHLPAVSPTGRFGVARLAAWLTPSRTTTPYVDALLEYSARETGPLPGAGTQGWDRRRPGDGRAGRDDRADQRHPLGHRGRRHRPRTDAVPAGAAARRRGLGRAPHLVPDQRRLAGQPRDLDGARPHGRARWSCSATSTRR